MGKEGYLALERREISRSMASRMNSARLFGPASSSMRSATSSVDKLKEALQHLVDAVGNMRVPQNTAEAAVQVALTIGPALTSARQALQDSKP